MEDDKRSETLQILADAREQIPFLKKLIEISEKSTGQENKIIKLRQLILLIQGDEQLVIQIIKMTKKKNKTRKF